MNGRITKEWIRKAEEDYETAVSLVRKRKKMVPNAICFHSQQCIEKYLKAFLTSQSIAPPEIHDLQSLRERCARVDNDFDKLSLQLDILNAYAVNFRYPGEEATVSESKKAVLVMKQVRKFIRNKIQKE